MAKKYDVGDVHAPVEDTDVPFSLKLLVLVMLSLLGGVSFIITLIANNRGLLNEFFR